MASGAALEHYTVTALQAEGGNLHQGIGPGFEATPITPMGQVTLYNSGPRQPGESSVLPTGSSSWIRLLMPSITSAIFGWSNSTFQEGLRQVFPLAPLGLFPVGFDDFSLPVAQRPGNLRQRPVLVPAQAASLMDASLTWQAKSSIPILTSPLSKAFLFF